MDHDFENPFDPSSSSSSSPSSSRDDEKVDEESVNDLLEECWFFDNLFKTKPRMLRSYSDPCCPPSKLSQEISTKNSDIQTIIEKKKKKIQRNLIRAPKMEENQEKKESSKLTRHHLIQPASSGKKEASMEKEGASGRQYSRRKLQRTPSLPSYFEREDNEESDARMSKLIQQAFDTTSAILPKPHSSKGLTRSCSISRYRPPRKSPSDLPGMQEKINREGLNRENSRRAYLSEAWLSQKCAPPPPPAPPASPPVPNWASKSSSEDMKAQIKFWARAVASNVRQEC